METALGEPGADAALRLYVEVSGLASRGHEPYRTVASAVARGWLAWLAPQLDVPEEERAGAAAGILVLVDGLLLVRFVASEEVAGRAAAWLATQLGHAGSA